MAKSTFDEPLKRFNLETAWLQLEFLKPIGTETRQSQLTREMAVIRLHDAWARICREIVILSALGNTFTIRGTQLNSSLPGIQNRSQVIPYLLSTYQKRKEEPKWASAMECIDAASRLRIANLATFSAAIGAANSPADHIRNVRNFYAHRSWSTSTKAMGTGCFGASNKPYIFTLRSFASGGQTILEFWIASLRSIASAAAE
jgi:hypothetical protein